MSECIVVGKANAGKTLFLVSFAEFLGCKKMALARQLPDGGSESLDLSSRDARQVLVDNRPHTTRSLQTVSVNLPAGKGKKIVQLTDTSGISEEIHESLEIRRAQAQTLRRLMQSNLILHLVDAARVGSAGAREALGEVDYQISRYAPLRGAYAVLANKIDLPRAGEGVKAICREFSGHLVLPISALHKKGFREVEAFVWRNI